MSVRPRPWEDFPDIWKTEAAFLSWVRGGIRRYLWSKNPVKLEFAKARRIKIANTNEKSKLRNPFVWGYVCEQCGKETPQSNVEIDHKTGEFSLKRVEDIQSFVEGVVFVRMEDLAVLCKPCHEIKTYAERYGLPLEEAGIVKQVIEIQKKKGYDKELLIAAGVTPGRNATIRREQLIEYLSKGGKS
ncbi:putative HNH endonuclease [Pseudomonas phage EM]|uniref:HNH endonuclease n=1 Tax=Pseudomonas phage EM TaxID=2936914 RepID=A0AAE9KSK8_9CAUD|nr:putative HNH endonuclease [Pseudomonas phage EM]UPW35928.1 putative HNH endonuclease [Pseudomonas phage EM]